MNEEELKKFLAETKEEITKSVLRRDEEIKAHGKATEETGKRLDEATKRLDHITAEFQKSEARVVELEKAAQRNLSNRSEVRETLGSFCVKSEVFQEMARSQTANNRMVEVNKELIFSGASSAGSLIIPDYRQEVKVDPNRPMFIRQLLTSLPTTSNGVKIAREKIFTNRAAPQASPALDGPLYKLANKNESKIEWEMINVPIETIAHWVPAERQALADAPRLARLIDGRLVYGLHLAGDNQILYGSGSNNDLTGFMVDEDISNLGMIPLSVDADDLPGAMLDHIRRAVTRCQTYEYYNMTGVVVNPEDWETLELAKGSDGHYIWVNVNNGGEPRLWRVPVVITNAMTKGDFILGDWKMGATLYEREGISIRVADQHGELFVKNGVVILAEERYGLGIELPKAFCKGSFEQGS